MIDNQPAGTYEAAAVRRLRALELRLDGQSYRAIGAQLGVSGKTAWEDVQASLSELAALELANAAELRALELERLDTLTIEAARILRAPHPYVAGGKVLPDLTDDGPKLQAIDRLLRISESRRKLLGLDAPALTALTNPDGTPAAQAYIEFRTLLLQALPPEQRVLLADALEVLDNGEQLDH